jgi:hypothetical protein
VSTKPYIVAVRFPGSYKVYDYLSLVPLAVGDLVVVETPRGEATVTVAELKAESTRAQAYVVRLAEKERDY